MPVGEGLFIRDGLDGVLLACRAVLSSNSAQAGELDLLRRLDCLLRFCYLRDFGYNQHHIDEKSAAVFTDGLMHNLHHLLSLTFDR